MKKTGFITFISVFITIAVYGQGPDKEKINDYFQNQQYEDAIDYLKPFYIKDSVNLQTLTSLGYAFYMNDEKESARIYFQKIFNIDSNNISANQYLANINMAGNHYDDAKVFVLRLISINSSRSSYFRILATIFKKNREEDSARYFYERAYRLEPSDNKNILAYADILINDSNYRRADSILKVGLIRESSNISFLKLLIQSSYESKNFAGIIPPGEKLIAMGELPVLPVSILSKLVFAYYSLKKYGDCILLCQLMDSNFIAGESTYYYESMSWAKLDKFELSNDLLAKCLSYSISKTSELYYYNLARNNETLKNYQKAIANYDTAYYLFKNPFMIYNGGRIYDEHLKNYKKAKIYYSKYLLVAKPETGEEKKLYRFVKNRYSEIH
jgi:tetratricopeptide (TPR) repeat protein